MLLSFVGEGDICLTAGKFTKDVPCRFPVTDEIERFGNDMAFHGILGVMNQFDDMGVVLSVRPHGEAGAIISVLTENHGKANGYVNGARASARLRSALQHGNLVQVDWQSKSEGQLGRFVIETEREYAAHIMDDARALVFLQSACALMDMFLPEREAHKGLFHGSVALFDLLAGDNWAPAYIMWEMAFLKDLGYGIDLSACAVTGTRENLTHISPKTGRAVCAAEALPYAHKLLAIPQFMQGNSMAADDVYHGLRLTGYFLIHRLLSHSSYQTLPKARIQLENAFNPAILDA